MEKYYKVSESELKRLITRDYILLALERGGVDNWDWYSDSLNDFLKEDESPSFDKIAEWELREYKEV